MQALTIGKIARSSGIAVETIRYYEREGLIDKPQRAPSGYRHYAPAAVQRLRFIRHAKELGFSLREIRELLSLRVRRGTTCADIKRQAQDKIADIERRMASLERMKLALVRLSAACTGKGPAADCPILDALEHEGLL